MDCENTNPRRATDTEESESSTTAPLPVAVDPLDPPEDPPVDGVGEPDAPPGAGDEYPEEPHDV